MLLWYAALPESEEWLRLGVPEQSLRGWTVTEEAGGGFRSGTSAVGWDGK